jgi:hypothetical protein
MSVLCGCLPFEDLQWIFVIAGGIISSGFLWTTYWNDFKENLEGSLRWIAVAVMVVV